MAKYAAEWLYSKEPSISDLTPEIRKGEVTKLMVIWDLLLTYWGDKGRLGVKKLENCDDGNYRCHLA